MTRRCGALLAWDSTEASGYERSFYARPFSVASLFSESSLSPCDLTWPQIANVVEVERARPEESTSAILIWTEAWSLEVINRSISESSDRVEIGGIKLKGLECTHWWRHICEEHRDQRGCPAHGECS